MAPDELKFVRMEARIQEQQLVMAELGQQATGDGQQIDGTTKHKEAIANLQAERKDPTMSAILIGGCGTGCSDYVDLVVKPIVKANQYQKYGACEQTSNVANNDTTNDNGKTSNNNNNNNNNNEQSAKTAKSKCSFGADRRGDGWQTGATIGGNKFVASEKVDVPPADGNPSSFVDKAMIKKKGQSQDNESQNDENGQQQDPCLIQRLAKVIPCFGILLSLCASVFLGTAGMLVKLIESVHGIQVAVSRALIQLVIYAAIISFRHNKWVPNRQEVLPVIMRAMFGGISITFSYCCLKLIPLGDATTIRFSLPIWTLIMSYFLLNESCTMYKVAAVFISISGVILVTKPDDCIYILHWLLKLVFNYETSTRFDAMPTMFFATDDEPPANDGAAIRDIEEIAMVVEAPPPLGLVLGGRSTAQNESIYLEHGYQQKQQQRQPENYIMNHAGNGHNYTATTTTTQTSTTLMLSDGRQSKPSELLLVGATSDPLRQVEGCLMALASSICLALSIIALRMCKQTPSEVTIFWLSVTSVVVGSVSLAMLDEWSMPTNVLDCVLILLNGLCGALGQWFVTNSLKVEQSGLIALARTFDIEVAFLYSALLLGEQIRVTSIIGSILVTLGVVTVLVPRWLGCGCFGRPTTTDDDDDDDDNNSNNNDRHCNDRASQTSHVHDEATSTSSGASSGATDERGLFRSQQETTILSGQSTDVRASVSIEHLRQSLGAHSKL